MAGSNRADYREVQTTMVMNKAREGDREAANELLRRMLPMLNKYIHTNRKNQHLKGKFDTQDLTQDVAIELVRYLPRLEASNSAMLEGYLKTVARSLICERHRQLMTARRNVMRERPIAYDSSVSFEPLVDPATSVSHQVSKQEEAARIRALLPLLGPLDEELFLRYKMLGEDAVVIAKDFGKADSWVRMRALRAYGKLVKLVNLAREGRLSGALEAIVDEPMHDDDEDEPESVAVAAR